ncbi:MAG: alpha/beta hydrolase [Lachnospiraceae bacterium]|nr:alpha/beta hydrolase [Lachnospiraceae bacterium]
MAYTTFHGRFHCSDHHNRIQYYVYEPEDEVSAVVQVIHGLWESMVEFEEMVEYLTDRGIAVCGCDQLGHGASLNDDLYGYFGEKNGWMILVKDQVRFSKYVRKIYPETPLYLYGSGFGASIARITVRNLPYCDGMILEGCPGKIRGTRRMILISSILKRIQGSEHPFITFEKLSQYVMNGRKGTLKVNSKRYPVSSWEDIFILSAVSNRKTDKIKGHVGRVLLLYGEEDPLYKMGTGMGGILHQFNKGGSHIQSYCYQSMAHLLHKGEGSQRVFSDIATWILA